MHCSQPSSGLLRPHRHHQPCLCSLPFYPLPLHASFKLKPANPCTQPRAHLRRRGRTTCRAVGEEAGLPVLPVQLVQGGEGTHAQQPGVYMVYSQRGKLEYVGMSKQMGLSLEGHLQALGPELVHSARILPVPSGSKAELQQAWKQAIVATVGSVPPGNAKGNTSWTQKPSTPSPQTTQAGGPRFAAAASGAGPQANISPDSLRASTVAAAHPTAQSIFTEDHMHQLCTQGWFVVDNTADEGTIASARKGAEKLRDVGLMKPVATQRDQGRLDEILVLNERQGSSLTVASAEAKQPETHAALCTPEAGALAGLAAMLKGIPAAIMQQQQQQQQARQSQSSSNSSRSGSQNQAWQPPELAVPQSLMLACYPGEETYYARHKDNDSSYQSQSSEERKNSPAWAGPPGQRVRDRAVTSILYLNQGWQADKDGGCLRLYHTDGSGHFTDVAPESGQLVVFQACAVEHEVMPAFRQRWALSAWVPTLQAFWE